MITMQQAKDIIMQHLPGSKTIRLPLQQACGRALSQDVRADRPSPACDNSAMDGFAVRYADVIANDAKEGLKIIGESRAGLPFDEPLRQGCAVRISTGAKTPPGADTVVPIEECSVDGDRLFVIGKIKPGRHIRRMGEEFHAGELLLRAGTIIQPPQIALLAHLGRAQVAVYEAPKVSLCVTGSELRRADDAAEDFQVRDSNSPMLAAAVRSAGGEVVSISRVGDDLTDTMDALIRAAESADLIFFTGGVSVGAHDHVKEAARRSGFEEKFWRIRQKPGKPMFFAVKGEKLLFGLPGNPVSAFMNYLVYIDPIIRRLVDPNYRPKTLIVRSAEEIKNNGDRTQLLRALLDDSQEPPLVKAGAHQGSHMIRSLTEAHGYLVVEPGQAVSHNELVTFHPFPWRR